MDGGGLMPHDGRWPWRTPDSERRSRRRRKPKEYENPPMPKGVMPVRFRPGAPRNVDKAVHFDSLDSPLFPEKPRKPPQIESIRLA